MLAEGIPFLRKDFYPTERDEAVLIPRNSQPPERQLTYLRQLRTRHESSAAEPSYHFGTAFSNRNNYECPVRKGNLNNSTLSSPVMAIKPLKEESDLTDEQKKIPEKWIKNLATCNRMRDVDASEIRAKIWGRVFD